MFTAHTTSVSIDKKIYTAQEKSELLFKRKPTWEEQINNLLDRMNELNGLLMPLHTILLQLTIEIERDFEGFKKSEIASDSLKKLNLATAKILRLVRKSDLYPGVKTTYYLIKEENNYLRELLEDRNTGIELEGDAEMLTIMKDTVKAINKNKFMKHK